MFQTFRAVDRVQQRSASSYVRETNDVLVFQKTRKNKDETSTVVELIRVSRAKMKEIGIEEPGQGVLFVTDDVKGYFAVLPKEKAKAFQGRADVKSKSHETGYPEALQTLQDLGFLSADRNTETKTAFDLVEVGAEGLKAVQDGIDADIVGLYELVPAEVIAFVKKAEVEGTEAGEPTGEPIETESQEEEEEDDLDPEDNSF